MPTTRTPTKPAAAPDDAPVVEVVVPADPRADALAALMQPPPVTVSDLAPEPAVRRPPEPTGARLDWDETGDWYLVLADVYPRMVGEDRRHARAGDLIRAAADDRTAADLAAGYLAPEE